jgi:Transposase DDE domain
MLPLADLFVHVYVLIDDAIATKTIPIPPWPGPRPACTDAEVLTIALVRHLLGRSSEAAWLGGVRRDWHAWFPHLPHQSEVNRRVRWLWGAFELLRQHLADRLPTDGWEQIDTSALPVKHPSRVRGPDGWTGWAGLHASFGRDAAHAEWFYGFRLAVRTDLDSRLVRAWGIVPAAVNERTVAEDLLDARSPDGLVLDRGFIGRAWAAARAQRGTRVVVAHNRA